jgi:hypothetical protein
MDGLERGDRLTEKELSQYKALKTRIVHNEQKLESLKKKDVRIVDGKVKGSSKYFPYIETHYSVQMYDPKENDKLIKQIGKLEHDILKDKNKIQRIEDFINSITDPELQTVFEMRVYENMNWIDIAAEIDIDKDRTTYSKKFKKYIENSHDSPISQNHVV